MSVKSFIDVKQFWHPTLLSSCRKYRKLAIDSKRQLRK